MPLSKERDRDRKRLAKLESNNVQPKPLYPVQPNDMKAKLATQGIQLDGNKIRLEKTNVKPEMQSVVIPIYNPAIHRSGDRVLVRPPYGKKLVEIVIPELDADGNPVPELT